MSRKKRHESEKKINTDSATIRPPRIFRSQNSERDEKLLRQQIALDECAAIEIEMKKEMRGDLRANITQHSITFNASPARLVSL